MRIDLRSDTVTRPSKDMKEAMFSAKLGDDVLGDDPSVTEFEQACAQYFGYESAVFCPSGTMTNQIALQVHLNRGDEVICDQRSHIYRYEGGGIMMHAGASIRMVDAEKGVLNSEHILSNINNPQDPHLPLTKLVSIENTVNRAGGTCYTLDEMRSLSQLCKEQGLIFHVDGARIMNMVVAHGIKGKDLSGVFDSVSVCFSKGLACPVGSILLGSDAFMYRARRFRKAMGGGMRQAGMLAAAGMYALEHHVDRLQDDHTLAQEFATLVKGFSWVDSVIEPETNIVIFNIADGIEVQSVIHHFEEHDIHFFPFGGKMVRLVTHMDLPAESLARFEEVGKVFN